MMLPGGSGWLPDSVPVFSEHILPAFWNTAPFGSRLPA